MIHQDPPHQAGGDGEELRAILPVRLALFHQLQVRLVDQRGGLQGVVRPFAAHVAGGQAMQLAFDQRREPLQGRLVAAANFGQ